MGWTIYIRHGEKTVAKWKSVNSNPIEQFNKWALYGHGELLKSDGFPSRWKMKAWPLLSTLEIKGRDIFADTANVPRDAELDVEAWDQG